ncbi:imidazole glycerol phosphate synthase subunit HisH [Deltaproteobacteria bacterium]|nr:imidazole glycerol phosphate synthase subunit HisH [Deltaproteobacteria bacterium]
MKKVSILDYGIGNLKSVRNAFEHLGANVMIATSPYHILDANSLVLPGVGSFSDGMKELVSRNLVHAIQEYAKSNRPLLGICLGMQLLFQSSEEFGEHSGLGIIPGLVKKIPDKATDGASVKVPHISWSSLETVNKDWTNTLLCDLVEHDEMYFVHSFTAWPTDEDDRLADTLYFGNRISAVVHKKNIFGCQFHPERSGEKGLNVLFNFLRI